MSSRFPPLVGRLIPSLGRDNDHEIVTTARAIGAALRANGQDFHDLAKAISTASRPIVLHDREVPEGYAGPGSWTSRYAARHAMSDRDRANWLASYGVVYLNEREMQFVSDLASRLSRYGSRTTPKQAAWLDALFERARPAA